MNRKTTINLINFCLLASFLLTACGGLSPEAIDAQAKQIALPLIATYEAGAPLSAAEATSTPLPAPAAAPTRTPPPANLASLQMLNLAACCSGRDFEIDPAQVWRGADVQIVTEAFVGLTRQNEETAQVEPGMAISWDVSPDGRVWTFHLRTDVPWVRYNLATQSVEQTARYVTASDFEYGIKRILDPATEADNAYLLYLIEGAEDFNAGDGSASDVGVEALDDSTLEIRLTQPAGYFDVVADSWAMAAQPEWVIEAHDDEWTEDDNIQSYGPYVLEEWEHDSHLILVKNPYWPGTESIPQPIIEEITWTLMDDEVAFVEYQTGGLDMVQVLQDDLAIVQPDPQLAAQLAVQPRLVNYYYGFNTLKPPFDDPRVRLAFSLAIDRPALIDEALQGNHEAARWFSPPGMRAAPTIEEYPTLGVAYDPDKARDLLDEVYPDRSQIPPITLAFNTSTSHQATAESIQAMWADTLGVQVELESSGWSEYLDLLKDDAPQIWRLGWSPDCADVHYFLSDLFHGDSDYNYTNWSSSAFDSLLDEAAFSTDIAARTDLYAQAEDILVAQDAAIIPLYWYTRGALTQPYVRRTYSQIGEMERFEKWAIAEH